MNLTIKLENYKRCDSCPELQERPYGYNSVCGYNESYKPVFISKIQEIIGYYKRPADCIKENGK